MIAPMRLQRILLLFSMLMSGFCGIIAELCLFNLANNLIGGMNVVLTYTMGVMMFCMGLGALTVKFRIFRSNHPMLFIGVESLISLLVAVCVIVIYFLAAHAPSLNLAWVLGFSAAIGYLIGFEIPLILLINERLKQPLQDNSALVFFADYLGSLLAFVLFSHVLLSHLGLALTAVLGAGLNWLIAALTALSFRKSITRAPLAGVLVTALGIGIGIIGLNTNTIMHRLEQLHHRHNIIYHQQTPYQKLVVTDGSRPGNPGYDHAHRERPQQTLLSTALDSSQYQVKRFRRFQGREDIRLFINGGLQFSTLDEHYYHEMMVHPAMYLHSTPKRVLIGGGGDGLALREVLKYPEVQEVLVIDIDPVITNLFANEPLLCRLNDSAYLDPRAQVLNTDIFTYLKNTNDTFDLMFLDFPDPHYDEVAKLYSRQMYQHVRSGLRPGGFVVTQSTSPYFNHSAFLIIKKTMEEVFTGNVLSYKVAMPTFGLWGFQLASPQVSADQLRSRLERFTAKAPTRFINRDIMQSSYRWSKDSFKGYAATPVNDWLKPTLVSAYVSGR